MDESIVEPIERNRREESGFREPMGDNDHWGSHPVSRSQAVENIFYAGAHPYMDEPQPVFENMAHEFRLRERITSSFLQIDMVPRSWGLAKPAADLKIELVAVDLAKRPVVLGTDSLRLTTDTTVRLHTFWADS